MEYAPGGDLQKVIDDDNVPFEGDVVKFVHHVVEGLAYMHQRKIAHLDIKPQNLVLMGAFPTCDVKLCDFEISRVILEGTEIREILGTPDYVAPEILHYEPITLAADMWSLGVTTYALLTGFSPFGGETDQETFCNISNADIDFPDELFEDVSAEAIDFIRKLLVRDPRERLTAKECLKHPWLANLRKSSSINISVPARRSGCNTCANSVSSTILSKRTGLQQSYLSKSREALFEKIVSKHIRQNEQKKFGLLGESQYVSARMCESHTSLVSRSRHGGPRTFSKSKEKLYGLKSLSKSQDMLDVCKSIKDLNEVDKIATVGSLLMSLTGVSTLPNSLCSSTANISVSQSHIPENVSDAAESTTEDDKENVERNGEVPRPPSPASSSSSSTTSSVEHFYHSDEEPRFTVAQLVKAFNTHQEVVTQRSLEVTMNTTNPIIKIPPPIVETGTDDPMFKFPTGPNALRLFIPNIDIGAGNTSKTKRTRDRQEQPDSRDEESAPSPNSDDCRKRTILDN
ncbi:death-associated protein kinase 3-like [Daktulosphaira vitifoliae]|uniref:death-associated protein kinase 3-like n=1 Tax=Daktulosphaira vitifoliae TaxID=58002 RepID=UPI0021A9BE99|nr:death-associated protein kinase 3-like [Daktulosphaira vitifoliae]XP_050529126.1 death-associated protein kinase 3-like [Daktulosphaira vitifoliae]